MFVAKAIKWEWTCCHTVSSIYAVISWRPVLQVWLFQLFRTLEVGGAFSSDAGWINLPDLLHQDPLIRSCRSYCDITQLCSHRIHHVPLPAAGTWETVFLFVFLLTSALVITNYTGTIIPFSVSGYIFVYILCLFLNVFCQNKPCEDIALGSGIDILFLLTKKVEAGRGAQQRQSGCFLWFRTLPLWTLW